MKPMKWSLLKWSLFGMILASSLFATGAQAGYDYIKYREEFVGQQRSKPSSTEQGKAFEHKSKYQREQEPAQGTELPAPSEQSKPGQKYDRPEWAK